MPCRSERVLAGGEEVSPEERLFDLLAGELSRGEPSAARVSMLCASLRDLELAGLARRLSSLPDDLRDALVVALGPVLAHLSPPAPPAPASCSVPGCAAPSVFGVRRVDGSESRFCVSHATQETVGA